MAIIFATDFSPASAPAGRLTARLARRLNEPVIVAHAIELQAVFSPEVVAAEPALVERLEGHAAGPMKVLIERLRDEGVTARGRVLHGRPDAAISELAREVEARLVVVGSHGRSAVARFLVGSVTERLVRAGSCPVLVVPPGRAGDAGASAEAGPLKLVVALERGRAGEAALAFVRALRRQTACDLTLVHLYTPEREHLRLGLDAPAHAYVSDPDTVAILERELRPLIADLPGTGATILRIRPSWGGQPDPLAWEAEMAGADLVLVGTQPRNGLTWSRPPVLDTVRAGTAPVLVVPAAPIVETRRLSPGGPIRSVLAATDLGPAAGLVVAEAYRLLMGTGGVLELVHAVEGGPSGVAPQVWADVQKQLWDLVPEAAERHGVVTRISVIEGPPGRAILQAAERMGCEAIVVGRSKPSSLARNGKGVIGELIDSSSRAVVVARGAA
jgi:nucleotide-binding universal stress UspA family protein